MDKFVSVFQKKILKKLSVIHGPGENTISKISSHIFLTNIKNITNAKLLQNSGITHIVLMNHKIDKKEIKKIQKLVSVHEWSINNQFFDEMITMINANNKIKLLFAAEDNVDFAFICYYFIKRKYFIDVKEENKKTWIKLLDDEYCVTEYVIMFIMQSRPCLQISPQLIYNILTYEYKHKDIIYKYIMQKYSKDEETIDDVLDRMFPDEQIEIPEKEEIPSLDILDEIYEEIDNNHKLFNLEDQD